MNIRIILASILSVVLASCSTMSSNIDYDPSFDFSKLKTYKWVANEKMAQADELFDKHGISGEFGEILWVTALLKAVRIS